MFWICKQLLSISILEKFDIKNLINTSFYSVIEYHKY